MSKHQQALSNLDRHYDREERKVIIPFSQFLEKCVEEPDVHIRNVFQVFHDMILNYTGELPDASDDNPYPSYDFSRLFRDYRNRPFFVNRVFGQRLIKWVKSVAQGTFQNRVFIFRGPPGSGKSIFLNNLLARFEGYANSEMGLRYEMVWRLAANDLTPEGEDHQQIMGKLERLLTPTTDRGNLSDLDLKSLETTSIQDNGFIDVPCPYHDHPILIIPKSRRREFLDELFRDSAFLYALFGDKAYEWVFNDLPCTICTSIYDALYNRLGSPGKVLDLLHARPFIFNRRLGQGISLHHPGDKPSRNEMTTNEMLQKRIDSLFRDSRSVNYIYSDYARSNNGIFALMDMKSHNIDRLMGLRNIISEGTHKIEAVEEKVNSLFLAVMNPDDLSVEKDERTLQYRIEYIDIPYILDIGDEVSIFRSMRGNHIDEAFLPRVLHNFARVIISSRLKPEPGILLEWIENPDRYHQYCDENLLLLKMELFTGYISPWLSDEDRAKLKPDLWRRILEEIGAEKGRGISGGDSVDLFNLFYDAHAGKDKFIDMHDLGTFFYDPPKRFQQACAFIPDGFLDALQRFYNFSVVSEFKEAAYYFDQHLVDQNIRKYIAGACRFFGLTSECDFLETGTDLTEDFLQEMEWRFLGSDAAASKRTAFRKGVRAEFQHRTEPEELTNQQQTIDQTTLYKALYERYKYYSHENALAPFLENQTYFNAIMDFGTERFKQYERPIRDDVTVLLHNLNEKYHYTDVSAKAISIYILKYKLAQQWLP